VAIRGFRGIALERLMNLADPLLRRVGVLGALCIVSATVLRLSGGASAWQRPIHPAAAKSDRALAPRLDFAALLPESALAYLEVPHVPTFFAGAKRTGVARALAQPEVDAFVASVLSNLSGDAAAARGILKTLDTALVPLLDGGAAVALLGASRRVDQLEAVFMADVSGNAKKARGFLGMLSMMLLAVGQVSEIAPGGHAATVARIGGREIGAWTVCDDMLIVATGEAVLTDILTSIESRRGSNLQTGSGLRGSRRFAGALDRALEDHPSDHVDYLAFADVVGILGGMYGDNARAVAAFYGLAGIDSLALIATIDEQIHETVFVSCPVAKPPLVASISARSGPLLSPDYLPSQTLIAFAGKADMAMLVRQLSGAMGLGDASPSRRCGRSLADAAKEFVDGPLQVLADQTSGEIALAYWSAARVNFSPMAGMAAQLRDQTSGGDPAERIMASLTAVLGGRARRALIGDSPDGRRFVMNYVEGASVRLPLLRSPACGRLDGVLLAASDPRGVLDLESETGPRLSAADGFVALLSELPQTRSCVLYVDVPRIVDRAFEPYARLALATLLPGTNVGRDRLPSGAAIAAHLSPSGLSLIGHRDGLRISASTPAGLPLTAGAAALIGARLMESL
jgi:hypothetical protein